MLLDARKRLYIVANELATPTIDRRLRPRLEVGTKPVDLTYLRRFTLSDADLEREILDLFVTHTPRYMMSLRAAVTAKEWHDAAHTMKGAARGIGAWRLGRCAEAAERMSFDADSDRRAFILDSASEAMHEAIGYINTLPARAGATSSPTFR